MIKVNLTELLEARGISMYRLAKDTEIAYQTLWKLNTGRAQRIGFDLLEKICLRLDCTPGELLLINPGVAVKKKGARAK
ncbi:MAG: helix-turn-helix domain-containing protein [Blastocatellia bacterium]